MKEASQIYLNHNIVCLYKAVEEEGSYVYVGESKDCVWLEGVGIFRSLASVGVMHGSGYERLRSIESLEASRWLL